jgi:hypothetical protein
MDFSQRRFQRRLTLSPSLSRSFSFSPLLRRFSSLRRFSARLLDRIFCWTFVILLPVFAAAFVPPGHARGDVALETELAGL